MAEKIRLAVLRLAIEHEASPYGAVTISAGIATAGPTGFGRKPTALVDQADKALYLAKANKRNTTVCASSFAPAMDDREME